MNVRRYKARDMRDAMRQVREHQGADAVILSSRRIDGMLEVVAALEPAPDATSVQPGDPSIRSMSSVPVDPELAAMRRELSDLRSLLMQQQTLKEQDEWAARHPLAAEFVERLHKCGFGEKLARSLAGGTLEDTSAETAWSRIRTRLSASIATASPTVLEQGGMLALVGSTGVGKTTTLIRLALRQIRRMGQDSVILATLDRQRIGAYKQLQSFGQMAGIPVMLLENERDLLALSSRAVNGTLILIDTEGQAARDAAERRLFAQIRNQVALETWLVVAATHQAMVLRQVLQAFQGSDPSALVLTKVDEAEQLGETLSVLLEQRLGLVFYSDGQRIDDDFHKADTMRLTRLALQEAAGPAQSISLGTESRSFRESPAFIDTPPMTSRPLTREPLAREPLNSEPLNRLPLASQIRAPRESMVLESVMPFRKQVHAAH